MGLFRRKKKQAETIVEPIVVKESPVREPVVEIIANEKARDEVIEKAKQASNQLNELLVQNGFTIKIYLAAGGHPPSKSKGKIK